HRRWRDQVGPRRRDVVVGARAAAAPRWRARSKIPMVDLAAGWNDVPGNGHAHRGHTMSEYRADQSSPAPASGNPEVSINPLVLHKSRLPFTISLASFLALLLLIFAPALISVFTGKPTNFNFDFGPGQT